MGATSTAPVSVQTTLLSTVFSCVITHTIFVSVILYYFDEPRLNLDIHGLHPLNTTVTQSLKATAESIFEFTTVVRGTYLVHSMTFFIAAFKYCVRLNVIIGCYSTAFLVFHVYKWYLFGLK